MVVAFDDDDDSGGGGGVLSSPFQYIATLAISPVF